uniref:Ionotropic glutamate receptor L-glutamate and glycine-binding domain-containing protein n=1 Tax=Strigamia maritima TaxID=126957 RepID=T1INX6_STRMM
MGQRAFVPSTEGPSADGTKGFCPVYGGSLCGRDTSADGKKYGWTRGGLPDLGIAIVDNEMIMEGFCGQLISDLHTKFNISFRLIETKDGQFGRLKRNGNWTGMIGDVVYDKADIAACVTPTVTRNQFVDFSPELYFSNNRILYRKLDDKEWSYTFFLNPFKTKDWLSIFTISSIIIIMKQVSNYFLVKTRIRSIMSDFLLCWPIVLLSNEPVSSVTSWNISMLIYRTFTIFMLLMYTSLLTASFSTVKHEIPFSSLEEMVIEDDYVIHVVSGYSIIEFVTQTYQTNRLVEVESIAQGVEAVFRGQAGLIIPPEVIGKFIDKNCSLGFAPKHVFRETVSMAYSKQFPFKDYFSRKILQFKETGVLSVLYSRYMYIWQDCLLGNLFHPVDILQIFGPIIFYLIGVLISIVDNLYNIKGWC